ncbi:MAG: hydratase [Clostridia bacterium]|nr:hydratase [Clostridia bacterium]
MVTITHGGVYYAGGKLIPDTPSAAAEIKNITGTDLDRDAARRGTMASKILTAHNTSSSEEKLRIKFDALASHDITYVGIIQTARASGLKEFPVPYVLTNCHNSLCAVGGTINEDDHVFGLSAAKKYGGIYVPAHQAVIHAFMREMFAGCGKMILGSDSHTRYGALGTMAVGEGGPEIVKQLLSRTYDIDRPGVIAVHLHGTPRRGVGPQDVAIALIGAVFANGFVKNKVLEFIGDGIAGLSMDYRCGIDVMTTETTCLSSIWVTDDKTKQYLEIHGRGGDYSPLSPDAVAYYDGVVDIDLSAVECMAALPFHPSNAVSINELNADPVKYLKEVEERAKDQLKLKSEFRLTDKITKDGIRVDQGVIAGCAGGTFENLCAAADILAGGSTGNGSFALSAYPASQPVFIELTKNGAVPALMQAGVTLRTAFCGPCFGAGDVPSNGALSIRHSTRNFENREGSKPGDGQIASVALMDARSIAATAKNGGILTAATEIDYEETERGYTFDDTVYKNRLYFGYGKADPEAELKFGPGIADWPEMAPLTDDLILKVAARITDPVTTTDELIPSGETSSYRSNPYKLSTFALSRKDPEYVSRAKAIAELEAARRAGEKFSHLDPAYETVIAAAKAISPDFSPENTGIGSLVYANKPGDGSAREQAASCQKVLGGWANIAHEYATKRYRSNLINWGMLPLTIEGEPPFEIGDFIFLRGILSSVRDNTCAVEAYVIKPTGETVKMPLSFSSLTEDERGIILAGCLINFYKNN